jgi:hypothetical protein
MKICYVNPTFLVRRPIADLISQQDDVAIFLPKKPEEVDPNLLASAVINEMKSWIKPPNPPLAALIGGTIFDECYDYWFN